MFNPVEKYNLILLILAINLILPYLEYGMRGIVSLAIAIGLSYTLQDGAPFPQWGEIVFISVASVHFTIYGQGLTLPWLLRRLKGGKKDA